MFRRGCSTFFFAKSPAVLCRTSRTVTFLSWGLLQTRVFQALFHVAHLQGVDHFIQLALHEKVQIVQCQTNPMVGHAVLRKVIRANLLFAAAGSNQASAMRRIFLGFLSLLFFQQSGAQDRESLLLVLLLAASVLASNNLPGWNMQNLHCRVGRVDALATRSPRSTHFNSNVLRPNLDIDFFGLR